MGAKKGNQIAVTATGIEHAFVIQVGYIGQCLKTNLLVMIVTPAQCQAAIFR